MSHLGPIEGIDAKEMRVLLALFERLELVLLRHSAHFIVVFHVVFFGGSGRKFENSAPTRGTHGSRRERGIGFTLIVKKVKKIIISGTTP